MALLSPLERTTNPSNSLLSLGWGGVGWGERERKKLVAKGLAAPAGGGNGEGESENKRGPGVSAHTALNNRNLSPHTVSRSKGSPFSWPSLVQPALDSFWTSSGTCSELFLGDSYLLHTSLPSALHARLPISHFHYSKTPRFLLALGPPQHPLWQSGAGALLG